MIKAVSTSKSSLAYIISISSTVAVLMFLHFHDSECQAQKGVKATMRWFLLKTFFKSKRNTDENDDKTAKSW